MKKTDTLLFALLSLLLVMGACKDNNNTEEEEVNPIVGTWRMTPAAGALAVGPSPTDFSWWSNSAEDVTTRACFFDDSYVFNEDGSFTNVLGSETWLETWQTGVEADGCGAPIAPHNGSTVGTWEYEDGVLTIVGNGTFVGLAKVHNTGENGDPANDTITYEATISGNVMTVLITGFGGQGGTETWKFGLTKQ